MAKKKSDDAPIEIVDDQGNKWHPFINCNVIRLFEEETGCGVDESLLQAVEAKKLAKTLRLAYLACAEETKGDDEKDGVTLDDFCAGFESDVSTASLVEGVASAIVRFFRSRSPKQNRADTVPAESPAPANG